MPAPRRTGSSAPAPRKTHGAAPSTHLRELAAGGETFTATFYKKTRYSVTSQPAGAVVTRNGEDAGKTPLCLDDVPTSTPIELSLKRDGFPVVGTGAEPARASLSNVTEVDCLFSKAQDKARCRVRPCTE